MNGFRFIRRRCNLSLTDVASVLGVSRQAVSFWENQKKEIPEKRKEELARYLGIAQEYLGEITEAEKQVLLSKAMFRHELNGKEIYRYCHDADVDKVYFLPEQDEALDEKAFQARKRKKDTIRVIEQTIDSGNSAGIEEMSNIIHRGCRDYEYTTELLERVALEPLLRKVPMRLEMESVWMAMELAYGVMDEDEFSKEEESNPYLDTAFIRKMADELKTHWDDKARKLDELEDKLEAQKHVMTESVEAKKNQKSLEERIREAEEDYRRMEKKPHGTMVYFL